MRYVIVSAARASRHALPAGCGVVRELSDLAVLVACRSDAAVPTGPGAVEIDPTTAQVLLNPSTNKEQS